MFFGLFRHAVDAKGRVAIPADFRRDLAGAVIAPGSEGRLVIRPAAEWSDYVRQFQLTASSSPEQRLFSRHLFASARAVELDSQGRILLTAEHRQFAGITDRAVFVGFNNVVELVGDQAWDAEVASMTPASFTELGDRVAPARVDRPTVIQ